MTLESVQVGKIELSDSSKIDFLERIVAQLSQRIHLLEEQVKTLKGERERGK